MRQTSVRLSPATLRQLEALTQAGWGMQSDIIRVAIDRMYQQEGPMNGKTTIVLNESGYDTGMNFADYCKLAAMHGDDPASHSSDINDFVFVSVDYAKQDPMWDVPEGWPKALPVWMYRPEEN